MHLFDRDVHLTQSEPLRFVGEISKNWLINGIANGGYVLAMAARAMQAVSDKHGTPIITANYMGRCLPGRVDLELNELSRSKTFTRFQAGLYQDGKEKVHAWGTFVADREESKAVRYEVGPPEVASREECIAVPGNPVYTITNNLEICLDPASAGWLNGELAERSDMRGWVRFREERAYDLPAILLMADAMPPPIFVSQGLIAWLPTIEFTVNVRQVPRAGWLKFRFYSRYLTGSIVDEDGELWDEDGNLICISRQIAQVRMQG